MFPQSFQKSPPTLLPLSSSTTAPTNTNTTNTNTDAPVDPLQPQPQPPPPPRQRSQSVSQATQSTQPSISSRRTKPPPLPISIPSPSFHLSTTTATATTPNWNDPPTSWTPNPRTTSASSTAFDINALYATANPHAAPRRRQSSMVKERETGALSAGLVSPMTVPQQSQQGGQSGQQAQGWQSQYHGIYGYDGDWPADRKIESARGSISVDVDSLGYGYGVVDAELRRRRMRSRRVVKGFVVVLLLVTVATLGVWVRGGPYTGLSSGGSLQDLSDPSMVPTSSSLFEGWGFNTSGKWPVPGISGGGVSMAELGERCLAWGSGWRSLVPGFLTRYFSSSSTGHRLQDGKAGDLEVETATQTVSLDKVLAWEVPGTMSRITRGRVFAATRVEGDENRGETILAQPRSIGPEEVLGQREVGSGGGRRVVLAEEAEARSVRAARSSAAWVKYAPLRPIHDVGHQGREEGKSGRGEL